MKESVVSISITDLTYIPYFKIHGNQHYRVWSDLRGYIFPCLCFKWENFSQLVLSSESELLSCSRKITQPSWCSVVGSLPVWETSRCPQPPTWWRGVQHYCIRFRGGNWLQSQRPSARLYGNYSLIIAINSSFSVNTRTRSAAKCHLY